MDDHIYIKLDDHWFDVTEYAKRHPGGEYIIKNYHLKDSTNAFDNVRGHIDSYHLLEDLEVTDQDIINTLNQKEIKNFY